MPSQCGQCVLEGDEVEINTTPSEGANIELVLNYLVNSFYLHSNASRTTYKARKMNQKYVEREIIKMHGWDPNKISTLIILLQLTTQLLGKMKNRLETKEGKCHLIDLESDYKKKFLP